MDPVITKILEGVPYSGMGSTLERNALVGVIRNLISQDKYTVDYILDYAQSVGYQRQMAEDVFKELTGLSPKLIVNNNDYYKMPSYVPNMCIAWGISKSNKEKAFYIVPFDYGYAVMEKDEINAPIPTVISATIPEAFLELKKVAKNIQTLDKIITKKLLETDDIQTTAHTVHQVNLPYTASPLQVLKKSFKDKVLSVSEFEKQASKMLRAGEITVDEAEDLMTWKQDLVEEDESYANEVLQETENWNEVQATVEFDDVMNEIKMMANDDRDFIGFKDDAKQKFDTNKELFQNVDLIEAATRLHQLLLGFSKEEILGDSKFESKSASDDSKFDYTYISKEEWDNTPDDYKMLIDGIKYMMFPINHENGGKLCPVKIKDASLEKQSGQEEYNGYIINIWQDPGLGRWNYEVLDKESGIKISEEHNLENLRLAQTLSRQDVDYMKQHFDTNASKKSAYKKQADIVPTKNITLEDGRTFTVRYNPNEKSITTILDENGKEIGVDGGTRLQLLRKLFPKGGPIFINKSSSKKVTAENMTLEDIETEDSKDQVQEEIDKIEEKPAEEVFSENTPAEYFEDSLKEDKVDTINEVVSKCIDKFSEKFKDFDKYDVQILSYNTKVLGDYTPVQEELVEDKELNANAILQVILSISNKADETQIKKCLAVFSVANGELHWTGTIRGENDQVVAFTEEGLDALFEVEEVQEDELEDII